MSGHRRGTYLTDVELAELERLAGASGLTPSSVLRVGLRRLAGLPVPRRELVALELEPDPPPAPCRQPRERHDYSGMGF